MAYTPTQWIDHLTEHPNRWTMVPNADGTVTLTPAFGEVVQAGTPISAANMNKIEQGIADAPDIAIDWVKLWSAYSTTSPRLSSDLNDEMVNSRVYSNSSTLNSPPGSWYVVDVFARASDRIMQVGYENGTGNNRRIFSRMFNDNGWSDWDEVWNSNSVPFPAQTNVNNEFASHQTFRNGLRVNDGGGPPYLEMRQNAGKFEFWPAGSGYGIPIQIGRDTNEVQIPGSLTVQDNDIWHDGRMRWNSAGFMEYNDGGTWRPVAGVKSVQRGLSNASGSTTDISISSVVTNKSFVTMNYTATREGSDNFSEYSARLINSTTLRIALSGAQTSASIPWEVIEYY